MKHSSYSWGTKIHEHTFFSASRSYLTMLAFYFARNKVSRLMREKGFAVKPFHQVVAFDHKGHGENSSGYSSYLEIVRSADLVVAHFKMI